MCRCASPLRIECVCTRTVVGERARMAARSCALEALARGTWICARERARCSADRCEAKQSRGGRTATLYSAHALPSASPTPSSICGESPTPLHSRKHQSAGHARGEPGPAQPRMALEQKQLRSESPAGPSRRAVAHIRKCARRTQCRTERRCTPQRRRPQGTAQRRPRRPSSALRAKPPEAAPARNW